jgi:hypothetical protein
MDILKEVAPWVTVVVIIVTSMLHYERRITRLESLQEFDKDSKNRKSR